MKAKKILFNSLADYGWRYIVYHPIKFCGDVYKDFRRAVERGIYGWARADTWDLGGHLGGWMPHALKYLEEDLHGCPIPDCPDCPFPPVGDKNRCTRDHFKEWKDIVRKIRHGFRAGYLLHDVGYPTWKQHHKKMREFLEKKEKEGLELFVKHIHDLWD